MKGYFAMYDDEPKKRSLIGTILYSLFFGLFIFIMSSFIINSCRMHDHEIADDIIFDENTKNAYEKGTENFKVIEYGLKDKRFASVQANQLLQLKYLYYIPSANQAQLTIKYNTSYAEPASDTSIPFDIVLKDKNGIEMTDYYYEHAEKDGYAYIRMAWNNVEFSDKSEYTLHIELEKDGKQIVDESFLLQHAQTPHREMRLHKGMFPEKK